MSAQIILTAEEEQRFWAKVNKNGPVPAHRPELGPCWVWTGNRNEKGYGYFHKSRPDRTTHGAHRVAFILNGGVLTSEKPMACHSCDVPHCCNPAHIFAGSNKDNMDDRDRKGRVAKGEKHYSKTKPDSERFRDRAPTYGNGRLKAEQVREMRARYAARNESGATLESIAKDYGVTLQNVHLIVHRKAWKHVE